MWGVGVGWCGRLLGLWSGLVSRCLRLSPFMWGVGVGWCGRIYCFGVAASRTKTCRNQNHRFQSKFAYCKLFGVYVGVILVVFCSHFCFQYGWQGIQCCSYGAKRWNAGGICASTAKPLESHLPTCTDQRPPPDAQPPSAKKSDRIPQSFQLIREEVSGSDNNDSTDGAKPANRSVWPPLPGQVGLR